jgi:5-deoxy-glucuronate isomerase
MGSDLYLPSGSTREHDLALSITPERAGWAYSGLRVLELPAGGTRELDTGGEELVLLPLAGSCAVDCDGEIATLAGRASVFDGPSDFAYLPVAAQVAVSSEQGGRFALASARAERRLPFRHGAAADVPVELRGAGSCSRRIHNFAAADSFEADRLIAVEVITPGGNWSSYPPHKHDEQTATETELEEIYYFEVADGPAGPGLAYQRVYGTAERPLDLLVEVRSGDVVLVPHGWHGPSMAAPGYDLYYLNVMAGPGERAWGISDDPAHGWVRETWAEQQVDPRLRDRP